MALKTKVKVGNITNLSDARYCAGMGVDWLSFPCSTIDPETFKEITDWVSGPKFIVELADENALLKAKDYPVHYVEIPVMQLDQSHLLPEMRLIVRMKGSEWETIQSQLENIRNHIEFLDFIESTGDMESDKKIVAQASKKCKVYVGFPLTPASLNQILQWPISGISLHGGKEEKPGLRDYSSLSTILELLETED